MIKKKTAFTLAEVLITLLIIGVVASIVIPAIIADTQQAEFKTAWKKVYAEVSQSTIKIMIDNGGTLKGLFQSNQDMINQYGNYLVYNKKCGNNNSCWHQANTWFRYDNSSVNQNQWYGFILNNGSILAPVMFDPDCNSTTSSGTVPKCGWMLVDVNGFKGPNTIEKDIFYIYILENRIAPRGIVGDTNNYACPGGGGCSAKYLYQ